jgi:hypothetical protein
MDELQAKEERPWRKTYPQNAYIQRARHHSPHFWHLTSASKDKQRPSIAAWIGLASKR